MWKPIPQGNDPDKYLITCFVMGDDARIIEQMDESSVKDEIESFLEKTYSKKVKKLKLDFNFKNGK